MARKQEIKCVFSNFFKFIYFWPLICSKNTLIKLSWMWYLAICVRYVGKITKRDDI